MNESLDRFTERRIEDRLRAALADHASGFEPSTNSYLVLAERVEAGGGPSPRPHRRGSRILAVAAGLVVLAGVGFAIVREMPGEVTVVGGPDGTGAATSAPAPTTTPSVVGSVVPTTGPVTSVPEPPPGDGSPDRPTSDGSVAAVELTRDPAVPASADSAEAVRWFLALVGLSGSADVSVDGPIVSLRPAGDPEAVISAVEVTETAGGFTVVGAGSPSIRIHDVRFDDETGDYVVVGDAIAFEAQVDITVVGADGTRLAATTATAGCCDELTPFEARFALYGVGDAYVVAQSSSGGGEQVTPFAAQPIRFSAGVDPNTYTVFRIQPDDPDRGLNVRDRPTTDKGGVLATLPPGTQGIRRSHRMPALVGDSHWYEIVAPDGTTGWVHGSFLVADRAPLGEERLVQVAEEFIYGMQAAESGGLGYVPLSRRVSVALGWWDGLDRIDGLELADVDTWVEPRRWRVPTGEFGEGEATISLRSLMDLPSVGEATFVPGGAFADPEERSFVDSYFRGTNAVTIERFDGDGAHGARTTLFVEQNPVGGAEIVGIVIAFG